MKRNITLSISDESFTYLRQYSNVSKFVDDLIGSYKDMNRLSQEEQDLANWQALEKNQQATIKENQSKDIRKAYLIEQIERLEGFIVQDKAFPSDLKRLEMFKAELEGLE